MTSALQTEVFVATSIFEVRSAIVVLFACNRASKSALSIFQIAVMMTRGPTAIAVDIVIFAFQMEALDLMPWQSPPCYADMRALDQPYGVAGAKRESAELALRMQRCGVSRWHPDPARECDSIEAERANSKPAK